MINTISAIFFDVGGTLRRNIARAEPSRASIVQQLLDMLGSTIPAVDFARTLAARADAYEEWAAANLIELDETHLWMDWMLPEYAPENIHPIALQLNRIWREAICERVLFPEVVPVIRDLHRMGYRLGVISNTTSSTDAPSMLKAAGIAKYMEVILLSCVFGKRKPDPAILVEAAARLSVPPAQCAYIGDRPEWDVLAARGAGFGVSVILRDLGKPLDGSLPLDLTPDYYINNLLELLPLFSSQPG